MDPAGWLGYPSTERRRARVLGSSVGPHARLGVGGAVLAGALATQRRRRRGLRTGARDLVSTATSAAAALAAHGSGGSRPGAADREREAAAAERARLATPVDVHRPAVGERWVTAVEVVLVAFEWTFWFATWAAEIDRRSPWYSPAYVAAGLLALVTPLLGVAGARLGGTLAHRLLRGYPGVGRFERIGAVSGLSLAAASVAVIGWLAHWRFTAGAGIGAVAVPAAAMALVFGLVVVLDVLLRALGVSQSHQDRVRRDRDVRADRRRTARAAAAVLAADARTRNAWNVLRTRVQDALTAAELVVVAGDTLITDAVVVTTADAPAAVAGPAVPAHAGGAEGRALPHAGRQRILDGDHHIPFPLRHVADAIDVLAAYPPAGSGDSAQILQDLRRRLTAVGGTGAAPVVVPAPRSANGHRMPWHVTGSRS
ncbi:hypothetical protein [Pseudonocardia sp. ICBG1034]|uniref:hypothetical protein n=1 Tax=Pseudonocardia sp. ICBG1034 TaxID=2844381 RepID=UPI001CCAA48D|nr:hypothetical protein [Pseudonocardia sp. ICBG1034]